MQIESSSLAGIQARSILDQARANDVSSLQSTLQGGAHDSPAVAAKKFESLLATQLVKEMRRSLGDGFFGEGPQADVYSGWLDQYLGEALARDGGLHLGEGLKRSLEQKQAAQDALANPENAAGSKPALKSGGEASMTTKEGSGVGVSALSNVGARADVLSVTAARVTKSLGTQEEAR